MEGKKVIVNMLDLSTGNISEATAAEIRDEFFEPYGLVSYETPYGFFVCCDNEIELEKLPKDLREAIIYAKMHDCSWLHFDRDAEYIKDLRAYKWD